MEKYLIESPHSAEECQQVLDAILMMGTDFVDRFDFGCRDGIHTSWAIVYAENEEAARKMIPPFVRNKARIVKVNKFTPQQIRAAHRANGIR